MSQPEIGCSLSVKDHRSSFSCGIFLRLAGTDDKYALSVFHGLNTSATRIDESTHPPIKIQQPSAPDYDNVIDELKTVISRFSEGPWAKRGNAQLEVEDARQRIKNLEQKTLAFGTVMCGELDVVECDDGKRSVDWCLIKLDEGRSGENFITFVPDSLADQYTFYPRDGIRCWITGGGDLEVGDRVIKAGKATGATCATVNYVKFDVRLPCSPCVTAEYTATSVPGNYFSIPGDSGAPVVGGGGVLSGMVIGGSSGTLIVPNHEDHGYVKLSYITPWELIRTRIKETLGREAVIETIDKVRISSNGKEVLPA
jgi:hypothetical protein